MLEGSSPLTYLVIMRRKLMQQLSHTILLPRTVDIWHFVVGYLREIQANLRENREQRIENREEIMENGDPSGKYIAECLNTVKEPPRTGGTKGQHRPTQRAEIFDFITLISRRSRSDRLADGFSI